MKTCNTCKERKPLTAFSVNRASKDFRQGKCRACAASYQAARHKPASTEELRAKRAQYARTYRKKKKMAEEEEAKLEKLAEKIVEKLEERPIDKLASRPGFMERYGHLFK